MTARKLGPHLPLGRPSKYRPHFAQDVVAFCAQGFTLTAYAATLGSYRDELIDWADRHPDFAYAIKRAKAASVYWWEQRAQKLADRGGSGGQVAMCIFMLKNHGPDEFRDKVEVTGKDGGALALDLILGKMSEPVTVEHEARELPPSAKDNNPKSSGDT